MNINWDQETTKEKEAVIRVLWRDYLKTNPNLSSEEKESRLILPINCKCGHHYVKNGKRKGVQKYLCKKCGSSFADSDRKVGRPCLFKVPLTGAEKSARSRAKAKN